MKNKQKPLILFIFLTLILTSLLFSATVQATPIYIAQNGTEEADGYGQNMDTNYLNVSQTFPALNTAYLTYATVQVYSIDRAGGVAHPIVTIGCTILNTTGGLPDDTKPIETSPNTYLLTSTKDYDYFTQTFSFSGDIQLHAGVTYALVVTCTWTACTVGTDYFVLSVSSGGITNGGTYYESSGTWTISNPAGYDCTTFYIFGENDPAPTPTPSPSPSPSPTPFTYQGDIWEALSPYANILLPLVLIVFIALLCGKYGGVWGFFAGLNVTAILVYAIMGASYMPLWGLVMLALVDGLLLFGKISGRM